MSNYPAKLEALLEDVDIFSDPADRATLLLSFADQFHEVPTSIAMRPY